MTRSSPTSSRVFFSREKVSVPATWLERHLRPYVSAVRKARAEKPLSLQEEHALRIECAARHLPENPLKDYGVQKHIEDAKSALVKTGMISETSLSWLPDVMIYFAWLNK